jgi:predicted nucleotidyltransferase
MSIPEEHKTKIINLIKALHPNVKIYLFGSQATNTAARGSDIDIALDAGKRMDLVEVGEVRDILNETRIPQKIDVVDFHQVPETMRYLILKEGILWKE